MNDDKSDISGIYNYCNRWCERCTFTSRCLTFKFGEIMDASIDESIKDNKVFWDFINSNLLNTVDYIIKNENDENEDREDITEETEYEDIDNINYSGEDSRIEREINESKEAPQLALKYIDLVSIWFEQTKTIFVKDKTNSKFSDSIEVIRWYHFFLYPKIMRAIGGKDEELLETEYPKDSDGTAKVVLVSIDHLISAWGYIFMKTDSKNNDVLEILKILVALQHLIEEEFPDARKFIRPGFDEET